MFATIGRSFRLIKESYRVLRQDPELIVLTLASFFGIAFVVVVAGGLGLGTGAFETSEGGISGGGYALLGITYFVGYGIVIYFQVALVTAVMHRMEGGDPDIAYALGQANRRLGAILTWALIAATVGLILRALESAARGRNGGGAIIGSILVSILGFAWALMVFFVIPVIAAEGVGGIEAIKRSSRTVKQRWGEAIVGNQGISLIVALATIVVAGIPIGLGAAVVGSSGPLGVFLIAVGVTIAVFMAAAGSALDSTYRAVLYEYAKNGQTGGFSREVLDSAFRPKEDLRATGL